MSDPAMRIFLCGLLKEEQSLVSCRGQTAGGFSTAQIFNEGSFSVGSPEILAGSAGRRHAAEPLCP